MIVSKLKKKTVCLNYNRRTAARVTIEAKNLEALDSTVLIVAGPSSTSDSSAALVDALSTAVSIAAASSESASPEMSRSASMSSPSRRFRPADTVTIRKLLTTTVWIDIVLRLVNALDVV